MTETELKAARDLYDELVKYFDDSQLQPPIKIGDKLHTAICNYRAALPKSYLPAVSAQLMLQLLRLSRSKATKQRGESQLVAADWGKLLLEKYPRLAVENPEEAEELDVDPRSMKLTETQQKIIEAVAEIESEVGDEKITGPMIAEKSGYKKDTVRHHISTLKRLGQITRDDDKGYRVNTV